MKIIVVEKCGECLFLYRFRHSNGRMGYQCEHSDKRFPKEDKAIMGFRVKYNSVHKKCPLKDLK